MQEQWGSAECAAEIRYNGARPDVAALVPDRARRVLDVGCSGGALGAFLKENRRDLWIEGIEIDDLAASAARNHLDRVLCCDAAEGITRLAVEGSQFDCIVFADVLEHLVDPWSVYDSACTLLNSPGWIVVSLPNIAHWSTHMALLRGSWPRRARGIHDATHLRFFGRKDVKELLERNSGRVLSLQRAYRLTERPHAVNRFAAPALRLAPAPFTYQFQALVELAPTRTTGSSREA